MADLAGTFVAAILTGLLGSLHCLGMCGATAASIIGLRTNQLAQQKQVTKGRRIILLTEMDTPTVRGSLAFNIGRIGSYMMAGFIVAGVAGTLAGRIVMDDVMPLRVSLFVFGQILVIATGLYIAGFTKLLAPFERLGGYFWRFLQRRFAPRLHAHGSGNLLALGALWGWIPCGLVYGTLATAMATGRFDFGALIMLGFGLGTMPMMFAAGASAGRLRQLATMPNVRLVAGAIVVLLGLVGLSRATSMSTLAAFGQFCSSAIQSVVRGAVVP